MTWLPIVIYVPALAFNQGTNAHRIIFNKPSRMELIYKIIYLQLPE